MEYPYVCGFCVDNVFEEAIEITLYTGMTIFVGPNGSGKTQTLKNIRDHFKQQIGNDKVRYLSSNRLGEMERYRSKINQYFYTPDDYQVGDRETKLARHEIETASGDFFTMDDKKDVYIKVAERLSVLFGRQIYLRWDAGSMKVFFEKTDKQKEYSVAVEASGLVNVISILAALFDEDIQVLLIDEPEVSLHPQLQSYLLHEMKNAIEKYKKTIILSTHSTELISFNDVEDFSNLVFFEEKKIPVQISPTAKELSNKKLRDFLVRMGQVYKNGFFAKKVLLIEGASDLVMCHAFINKLNLNIDAAGSQIIPVDGKGQFAVITKIFRLINKEVAILTDLDGFIDDNSILDLFINLPEASKIANKQGNGNISELVKGIKKKIGDLAEDHIDDMKSIYGKHPYWINRTKEEDQIKIIKRALVGQLFCEENIKDWPDFEEWESIKIRLEALFSILKQLGCFVLKKGAIESYYKFVPNTTYIEKPSAAVEEVSFIYEQNMEFIYENYIDIIEPLKYIAIMKTVDESFAIKKELLSELALVLEMLSRQTSEKEIYAAIKQAKKGDASSLFEYHIIKDGEKIGVEVNLKSKILDVQGFPFKIFNKQNVNEIVSENIKEIQII